MSNFLSLELVTGGLPGTAPQLFSGSTPDSLATITVAGYLNDIIKKTKANDIFWINYSDASVFPLYSGEASVNWVNSKRSITTSTGNMSLQQLAISRTA